MPRSGWSYPVGRSIVESSLRAAGVHLLSLDFRATGGDGPDVLLLSADRYSDIGTNPGLRRGTPDRSRACLSLYTVPSALRPGARVALLDEGVVDRACAWLAAAERANPTWLDKSHAWTAWLIDSRIRFVETER
ncbi:hypothetical protein [Dactylosporangium sp. NPDC005555]|uniref:hypothetical protein n=1 Tax=Dactylosporangium sp. NPDC005555 TaxID=3154889 RepID=UPI0033B8FA20